MNGFTAINDQNLDNVLVSEDLIRMVVKSALAVITEVPVPPQSVTVNVQESRFTPYDELHLHHLLYFDDVHMFIPKWILKRQVSLPLFYDGDDDNGS